MLHLSDLHRSPKQPLGNDLVLSALLADLDGHANESPQIHKPGAIVVSGDIVRGVTPDNTNPDDALRAQYHEARQFLDQLAKALVDGDKSRVVLIPGNHDVNWVRALASMTEVEPKKELLATLRDPSSRYRLDMRTLKLYEITDYEAYARRFEAYEEFFRAFYGDKLASLALDPVRPWNLHRLDEDRVVIAAFNSNIYNDCFSGAGDISPNSIAAVHLKIKELGLSPRLQIATWHHDIEGPPRRLDYMDVELVRQLIARGFRIGMHGHQHTSDLLIRNVRAAGPQAMIVCGAGSLCAGDADLPHGVNRQYNVIEVYDYTRVRIHVREELIENTFAPGRLASLGGATYADVPLSELPPIPMYPHSTRNSAPLADLQEVERMVREGEYENAVNRIRANAEIYGVHGRRLLFAALKGKNDWHSLIAEIGTPQTDDELTQLVMALISLRDFGMADERLRAASLVEGITPLIIRELQQRVKAERVIHG